METTDKKQERLGKIGNKGWEIAQKLQEVKANQNASLEDFGQLILNDTEEPPEVRLRRYLDQVNDARTRLLNDNYGTCLKCGKTLPEAALDEMPWVEWCQPCTTNA